MYVLVFNCYCIAGSDLVFVHSAIDPACCFLLAITKVCSFIRGVLREKIKIMAFCLMFCLVIVTFEVIIN